MSIFKKKSEEKNEPITVKNGGAAGLLIWRYPNDCIAVNSKLDVMPGEQAIFIRSGTICQVFDNGQYVLSPEQYSFIRRIINKITGKTPSFNCAVYFVNATHTRELRWGTQTPIQVRDKVYGIRTDVKARGALKIFITDPSAFLKKLIGSNVNYVDSDALDDYFASEFQGKIKSAISRLLNSLDRELIGIDEYADKLAFQIKPALDSIVAEYGLKCVSFSISGLDVDISKYDVIDKSQLESIAAVKKAQGDRGAMDILGADWDKQKSADLLHEMINSKSACIPPLTAHPSSFGTVFNAPPVSSQNAQSALPRQKSENAKPEYDPADALTRLKKLLDAGLIDEKEYAAKKSEILSKL